MKTSIDHLLRVDWVRAGALALPGRLGLTFAPGKRVPSLYGGRRQRDLEADLERLRSVFRVEVLVPLIEPFEFTLLGIEALPEQAERMGFEVIPFPIRDGGVPRAGEATAFRAFVGELLGRLGEGRRVVVHCRGGLGRSGLVAAGMLVAGGVPAEEAMREVRAARPGAIETAAQEAYVRAFAAGGAG